MPRGKPSICDSVTVCLQAFGIIGGDTYSQLAAEDLDEEEGGFAPAHALPPTYVSTHEGAMRRPSVSVAREIVDHLETKCQHGSYVTVHSEELTFLHDTINMLVEEVGEDGGHGSGSKNVESLLDQLDAKMRDEQAREYILDEYTHNRRRSSDLVNNHMKGIRAPSPVTVLGSKKQNAERASRRSIQLNELPLHVAQTAEASMAGLDDWAFNVWATKAVTSRPLKLVGMSIAVEYDLAKRLNVSDKVLLECFEAMDDGYHKNLYHNNYHAADVMQASHYMLEQVHTVELPWLLQAAILLAAAAHDIGHLGVNNQFLEASYHSLAIRYNNRAILENFHCATFFELLKVESRNIFKNLPKQDFVWIRSVIVKMILATDMSVHGNKLTAFNAKVESEQLDMHNDEDQVEMCCMLLHASDVSNPARPWDVYLKWVEPITEEFYRQGDSEAKAGLPVTPMMDRNNPIPTEKFQSGFINAIVLPLFKSLGAVKEIDLSEPLACIHQNDGKWKQKISEKAA